MYMYAMHCLSTLTGWVASCSMATIVWVIPNIKKWESGLLSGVKQCSQGRLLLAKTMVM